ncbi:hypothetical protein SLS58_003985 [Diplodia intermedia]|uniref:Heat shock protein 70 n=1 Tax=Diplodia intermedia TaxID=856260 RepID=A0ABR3TUP7_9PEZI
MLFEHISKLRTQEERSIEIQKDAVAGEKMDCLSMQGHNGSGMLELPHNDDSLASGPDNVIASNPHTRQNFKDKYTLLRRIECWITVPAAKDATRSAALDAGFGSRHLDKVNLMPEPETAALAIALKPRLDPASIDPISSGEDVLIYDCGEGTVDITTYTILETTPRLQFRGLCVGVGAKCGSTYIDRNFNKWMELFVGTSAKCGSTYTGILRVISVWINEIHR